MHEEGNIFVCTKEEKGDACGGERGNRWRDEGEKSVGRKIDYRTENF